MATAHHLPPGDYRIKYAGVGPPLNVYATSNGLHKTVTVAPGIPPNILERQIWKVLPKGPGYVLEAEKHPNDKWYYASGPEKDVPIILNHEAKEFYIEPADNTDDHLYFIKPVPVPVPHPPIGIDHFVDNEHNNVVIKTYPVVPGPRPKWQFIHWVQD